MPRSQNPSSPFLELGESLKGGDTDAYVHFYEFDETFSEVITNIDKHIPVLRRFVGVVTPDCSMLDGQSNCLQATNTFFNRAVGFRLQKAGIPVICNLRWSDESSFDYCFLGVPRGSIVSIGTYGTIKGRKRQDDFRKGWLVMLDAVKPSPLTKAILGLEAKAEVVLSGMCILTTHCLRLGFFTT